MLKKKEHDEFDIVEPDTEHLSFFFTRLILEKQRIPDLRCLQ